jgi:predicted AlkP superfamily phosphohydrolase/phosphomutase
MRADSGSRPDTSHLGTKVMVIGLDGMTLKLLLPLAESGRLPTFARLLRDGAFGVLRSVTNMTTGPTWASFATGCSPLKHGILHDFHHESGAYTLRPVSGADCREPAFWQIASEAGRTVIVLNVPQTYPARSVRGVLLAGIDAPSERAQGFDYPPGTYRELRRRGGDYIIDCGLAYYVQTGRIDRGAAAVNHETEGRTRAAEYFMNHLDWDLLVVVYSLPDVWQHYYWSDADTAVDAAGRDLVYNGYALIDRHVARLLAHLPTNGLVILCSDHGFGPLCSTRDHLNRWLAAQGYLRYNDVSHTDLPGRLANTLLSLARQRVSFRHRQQLMAKVPALRRALETRLRIGGIDWQHTQAYAALDHQELWLNVRGRQAYGCVAPTDQESFCQTLRSALLAWRDDRSGQPRIDSVHIRPYASALDMGSLAPDLLLEWNPDAAAPGLHPLISGDHHPDGTLIVAGQDIRSQHLQESALVDVAPLVLHALGLSAPRSMDGRVPPGLFDRTR